MISGPLNDVIVLDLTRVLAGPYCTGILFNLGATIIKIENPKGGDDSRQFTPFVDGESAYSCALNRGKKSIALDIKNSEKDREIFKRLVRQSDVLVENFRPGVLSRLGFDEKVLKELNPRLIVARISGFGKTGPDALRACYDLVAQGMSGLMSMTGEPQGKPVKAGIELADVGGGIFAAIGICAALFDRTRTGKGSYLGTSLLDCLVSLMFSAFSRYSVRGEIPEPTGTRHPFVAPFDVFYTQDKPITICVANDRLFETFCKALGKPELSKDSRFNNNTNRYSHVEELEALINDILKAKPAAEWLDIFEKQGIPAGPINKLNEVFEEPQLQYRKMIAHFSDNYMPQERFPGNPIKFSNHPDTDEFPRGPKLNEHAAEILTWLADREREK